MVKFGPRTAVGDFSPTGFFHVLDHLESIGKNFFSAKILARKNFEIYRDDVIISAIVINLNFFLSFFRAKIFAEKKICQSTPNGPKREKKPVGEKSPTADRRPNLTIFPCVGTQTKYRFRVSGYLDQK